METNVGGLNRGMENAETNVGGLNGRMGNTEEEKLEELINQLKLYWLKFKY